MFCHLRYVAWRVITSRAIRMTCTRQLHVELQAQRGLLSVEGPDAVGFLQGLITNDMNHFQNGALSVYSTFLNIQGRVLFDVILYKFGQNSFAIDCDKQILLSLEKHVKMYKIRKNVDIKNISEEFNIWTLFEANLNIGCLEATNVESLNIDSSAESTVELNVKVPQKYFLTRDPRLKYLGHRLILPFNIDVTSVIPVTICQGLYQTFRYKLGIAEGSSEMPSGQCFPLEANCDFLHGVNFHKGCYIGQELTARTFHTGVVRKRYMPLIFDRETSMQSDAKVLDGARRVVGKIRAVDGIFGLGLMRVSQCLAAETLTAEDIKVKTSIPGWWPPVEVA